MIYVNSLTVFPWSQRKQIILPVSRLNPVNGEKEGILRFMKEHMPSQFEGKSLQNLWE